MSGLRPAIFLDRDGVINRMWWDADHGLVDSPANPEQFTLFPGVGAAIRSLREMGFLAVVVSNQPGIAKGKLTAALLEAISARMVEELAREGAGLDGIYYCLHHPDAALAEYQGPCACRKPEPGLLLAAGEALGIDLPRSYMIGDGLTDVQAGRRAGCSTVWIGTRKCDVCHAMREHDAVPDLIAPNLTDAVRLLQFREVTHGNLY